ncbi:kinase-like protein, partial [Leptotrombidium deliense]
MDETPKPRLQDYQILAKIGSGGFGDVFKVMYNFDKQHYALKKIALQHDNRRQISREVACFSRLNHENVVRYYSAWIELNDSEDHDSESDEEKEETSEKDSPLKEEDELRLTSNGFSMSYVVFQTSTSQQQDEVDDDAESVISERRDSSGDKNSKIMHLYIQMELCEGNTLRDAIKSHSFLENDLRKRRLFKEIVKGLAYIHEQGIIHRDLNPRNIFLDSRDHVKIGDFGLAMTKMKDSEHQPSAHKPLRPRNAQ